MASFYAILAKSTIQIHPPTGLCQKPTPGESLKLSVYFARCHQRMDRRQRFELRSRLLTTRMPLKSIFIHVTVMGMRHEQG